MSGDLKIRAEQPTDHEAISTVVSLAFQREDEARLIAELRKLPSFDPALSLVAIAGGQLIGHILFTEIVVRQRGGTTLPAMALAPVAVRPERQRSGIGSRLVTEGLDACRRRGDRLVIVVGHAEYYPRFGFRPARDRGLEAPFPVSDASFMLCELTPPAGAAALSDMVEYPAPFQGV
ncbi:MAG TPA: N-acetyltransferase [Pirellulales bacterium]|nr:N-acetyltransferase [Pirellulales bacterium]